MSSQLISIIVKVVDRVVQSEETDGSETSAISIFRLTTTLSTVGEVSSKKKVQQKKLQLSQEIPTSSPEMCSFSAGLFGQRNW